MPINTVNTIEDARNFNYLGNKSTILRANKTNNIYFNGVNVIVDKPKVGDVMCVTRYTDEDGSLLPADNQEVVWIDGLSINPKQLSQEYEPVGICVAISGNKAMVRYREEKSFRWAAGERWELEYSQIMNNGTNNTLQITLNNEVNSNPFTFTSRSRLEFVNKLNEWFLANNVDYSAELVELDTDLPATNTSDVKRYYGNYSSYFNRVIVNARFISSNWNNINIEGIDKYNRNIGKHINGVYWYYINNDFTRRYEGGCCRSKYYDYIQKNQRSPKGTITNISVVTGGIWNGRCPARLVDFLDNVECQILRDNFATYDEYLDSMMIKLRCGKGGAITDFPSGKENTYKLANCTYLDNYTSEQEILYPAANWAASIDINAPGLQAGNWWLPSAKEMMQMMRDITYGTSFWDTKPDIVNRVLLKLTSIKYSGWSMLSSRTDRWTSTKLNSLDENDRAYNYDGDFGNLGELNLCSKRTVSPITLYEF